MMLDVEGPWVEISRQNSEPAPDGRTLVRAMVTVDDFGGPVTALATVEVDRKASQKEIERALLINAAERFKLAALHSAGDLELWLQESRADS